MSLAAYASEVNIICEFEMNVKKYFYWRSNISYHSNDTPPHYQEKFMSFSEYNSFSVTCPNLPAAALVILITEAADVWGRKDWWWPLKSHSRLSYLDRLKKNITHLSWSTFGKIFVQTFFLSLNILVKQTLPLPPSPNILKSTSLRTSQYPRIHLRTA